MQILLVGNPTAQSGKNAARIDRARAAMADRGWAVQLMPTEPAGRTVDTLRGRLAQHTPDVCVYMGGDGTFAEVAKGLLRAQGDGSPMPPLGMLPSGTANDQGKSFGISSAEAALAENLDIIGAGHTLRMDAGRVERIDTRTGRVSHADLFFDSVGWGMHPDILAVRNEDRAALRHIPFLRDVYRDHAVYAGAALERYLASWVEPTKFMASVQHDGGEQVFEGLTDLVIKGTAIYGGEWVLDRHSRPDDGRMELVPMQGRRDMFSKAIRDWKHLPIWQEHLDALGVRHSEGPSARAFEIQLARPGREDVQTQIDGEEWRAGRHFRVEVLPGVLPVIVRAGWVPPWRPREGI